MNYYRKKQSMYILTSCEIYTSLIELNYLIDDLFEKGNSRKLMMLRDKINNLIAYVEKLPVYGKPGTSRKPKESIYYKDKTYIIDGLKKLYWDLNEAFRTGKGRILKGADLLEQVFELRKYIYLIPVYQYNNENENEKAEQLSRVFVELKKSRKYKLTLMNGSHV